MAKSQILSAVLYDFVQCAQRNDGYSLTVSDYLSKFSKYKFTNYQHRKITHI